MKAILTLFESAKLELASVIIFSANPFLGIHLTSDFMSDLSIDTYKNLFFSEVFGIENANYSSHGMFLSVERMPKRKKAC